MYEDSKPLLFTWQGEFLRLNLARRRNMSFQPVPFTSIRPGGGSIKTRITTCFSEGMYSILADTGRQCKLHTERPLCQSHQGFDDAEERTQPQRPSGSEAQGPLAVRRQHYQLCHWASTHFLWNLFCCTSTQWKLLHIQYIPKPWHEKHSAWVILILF